MEPQNVWTSLPPYRCLRVCNDDDSFKNVVWVISSDLSWLVGFAGSVHASSTINTDPSCSSLTLALPSGNDPF